MARVRVTAATLKRLEAVERSFDEDDGPAGGVLLVPAIEYDLDTWERRAMAAQAKLVRESQEDVERRQAEEPQFAHPLPEPVVKGQRTHTPDPNRSQAAVPKRPPMPPTVTR